MKFPAIPPPFYDVLFANQGRSTEIFRNLKRLAAHSAKYLHWDDLRHRKPPEGFSKEEWWCAVRVNREGQSRKLPLLDTKGEVFTFFATETLQKLLHEIDRSAGRVISNSELVVNPEQRARYVMSSLMREAITSSMLEGAVTTIAKGKELLKSGRQPIGEAEIMVRNNFRTMRELISLKSEPLSLDLLFQIHSMITEGTLDDSSYGRLRNADDNVRVEDAESGEIAFVPPAAELLQDRLGILIKFANSEEDEGFVHPVVRAMILHFWVAYEHPFVDGNGRTARALFYWAMLKCGYDLFEFISISSVLLDAPKKYYRAFLHTESDGNDLNYFLLHQADVIRKAIDQLNDYMLLKSRELADVGNSLQGAINLNHRQRALLHHALRHPGQQYTVRSHQTSQNVSYNSARNDLQELADQNYLIQEKAGKGFVFKAHSNLSSRFKKS